MKRILSTLIAVTCAASVASASDNFSYTATATPGTQPDGVDQNNNPVNVWTLAQNPGVTNGGISGAYFGTAFGGETLSGWQIWTSPSGLPAGDGGFIEASNIFSSGPLSVGQTISINFEMRAADPGRDVGVSLLNGSGAAITFGIYGGEPNSSYPYTGNGYFYSDAVSSYASAGSMGYQYQHEFNISFTITGPNTYSAVAGSDSWSGTFSGQLLGIDVFNYGAGNGSDMGFNNLTVAPELAINNISLDDSVALFNATNTLSFVVNSPSSPVATSGVQLILNGVNVSSNLVFTGAGTENVSVSYTNLQPNQNYSGEILVTNQAVEGASAPLLFDTFSTNEYTWEAEDFDFNGGQFIDNPVLSTNSLLSYYGTEGVTNVDEYVPNFNPTNQPHLWRTNDEVSIAGAGDTPRAQFVAAGVPDYLIGYFNPSNWVNYTRTYPAGTYNIYGRLANGNGGLANCSLAEVTSGQGTTNQTLTPLGMFQFSARGWNSFNFVPLTDPWGNVQAVTLNGQTTLRVTSGPLGGGINANFFLLAPGTNTPPAIVNVYPDGLQPFETTNKLTFGVGSQISTISANKIQVLLNGVDVSPQLSLSGTPTSWSASLPLSQQAYYSLTITATDAGGRSKTYTETFDNFSQNNLMVEADEYDFNGGQFIDNSIQTATNYYAVNSYYPWPDFTEDGPANDGVSGIDYTTQNTNAGELFLYRYDDGAGTQLSSDFLRNKFINSGQDDATAPSAEPAGYTNNDFNIGWWNEGTWLNYTRTFPTNNYYVYGRLAGGVPYVGTTLSLVTSGQTTPDQMTQLLGSFSDPNANGFQSWHWVPLQNNGANVIVPLGGVETLKAAAGPGGNVNAHYYMFVPAVSTFAAFPLSASVSAGAIGITFQTQNGHSYTVLYSNSLNPPNWQTLKTVSGDGTVQTVPDTMSGPQRFYKVEAQ
ncbi:MAG TPA: hypothetical protein VH280_25050 [Verrucomicrobiae bacterium]|jgi:hypothetical protein|nr:hypothetical protein [Verrucomicrobiae bacterium]